jgi:simple sugar transport system permease protein
LISLKLVRRELLPLKYRILLPVASTLLAVIVSSIYVVIAGGDVFQVYYYLITWPLSYPTEIFVTATPLLLLALAITVAFKARFWNIGAHGQFIVGGLVAAWLGVVLKDLTPYILIPFILSIAWLGGSGVALISWWLKVKRNQDEVLTTILIWSAILLINAGLLTGPLRSPYTTYPQSQEIGINAKLPILIPGTRLHAGVIIPFIILVAVWVIFNRTSFRNKMIAVTVPRVAILEGINISRTYFWVAFLSGGIAGLTGAVELMGILYYMTPFVGPNYGLVALAIAMLGNLDPIGIMAAALFFSILINGANAMSWSTGVPSFLSDIIQAQTLIFLLIFSVFNMYRLVIIRGKAGEVKPQPIKLRSPTLNPETSRIKINKNIQRILITSTAIVFLFLILDLGYPGFRGSYIDSIASSIIGLTLVISAPIVFAAIGETFIERAGIINLGILGIMISGAAWGFMNAYFYRNIIYGVVAAAAVGAALGLIFAFLVVTLGVQQHIAGISITFFSMNLSYFFHRVLIGSPLVEPTVPPTPSLQVPILGNLPIIGSIFKQNLYTYIGVYVLAPIAVIILFKTRWGLIIRALGENPKTVDAARIRVHLSRYLSVMIGSMLMAIGGAYYSLIDLRSFNLNVGGEWSWIALALVILGNWNPLWVWLACIFFGMLNAVQAWLVATVIQIPYQFFQSIPYVVTIAASAILGKRVRPPKALLQPYRRE